MIHTLFRGKYMLLSVRSLTKTFGALPTLDAISFIVNSHERIGIVGSNGVGKSTLLRLLTGEEEPDAGTITYAPNVVFGYLPQSIPSFYGRTVQDLLLEAVGHLRQLEDRMRTIERDMSRVDETQVDALLQEYNEVVTQFQNLDGYEIDSKITIVLHGLHLSYLPQHQHVDALSGGEKVRLQLATLLLRSPDILLLDEPTNHLDFESMAWLENYLADYTGSALIVSHDRQFLNRAINRIYEIDEHTHTLKSYEGNYDAFVQAKTAERARWLEDYERQQEEIQDLRKRVKEAKQAAARVHYKPARDNDKFARHFFEQRVQGTSASKIKTAETLLARIETDPIPKPGEILRINSQFADETIRSQEVLRLINLTKSFGSHCLFNHVDFILTSSMRILLTGPNGAGKTTLLRLIIGEEEPDTGSIKIADSAHIGYLPQEPLLPDEHMTVIDAYRFGQIGYESDFIARLIGYGLFGLDDMHKTIQHLSLGQRRKLELARLIAQKPNVLLLDEPTNYISLDVLEAFEAALHDFSGPIIAISHDRWFIQHFKAEIWQLEHQQLRKQEDN